MNTVIKGERHLNFFPTHNAPGVGQDCLKNMPLYIRGISEIMEHIEANLFIKY